MTHILASPSWGLLVSPELLHGGGGCAAGHFANGEAAALRFFIHYTEPLSRLK